MTPKLILVATLLSFSALLTPAANSASTTSDVPKVEKEKPDSRVSPHSHMQEKLSVAAPTAANSEPQHTKKPLHDHNKFHKHQ